VLKPTGLAGLLLIFFALPALSQSFSPDLSRIPFNSIHVEDGLSNEAVYCLLQDKRGFVWIGTFGGLDRYDGKEVVSYKPGGTEGFSLSATVVFALAEGKAGTVWAGTDGGGLNRLDPENGRVDIFRGLEGGPDGLGSDLVYALAAEREDPLDRDRRRGAGPEEGSGRKVRALYGGGERSSIECRTLPAHRYRRRLWVGTASGGLVVTEDPGSERPSSSRCFSAEPVSFPTVRALYEDSVGRIWIGTEGNGLFMSDGIYPPRRKFACLIA
jgi:ligand-binding sensor domain-containing protein